MPFVACKCGHLLSLMPRSMVCTYLLTRDAWRQTVHATVEQWMRMERKAAERLRQLDEKCQHEEKEHRRLAALQVKHIKTFSRDAS